jgi:hypothetical protein
MNRVLMLKDQIYSFVQREGPIIPIKVAKHFKSDTLFISAILSELITGKKLKLTKAKIGSSPLYYAPGQEPKLANQLKPYLKQIFQTALELLQERKVLRDQDCEPAIRASLRELKDFAKPLTIQVEGNQELFWQYYTLSNEETKSLINEVLERVYKKEEVKPEIKEPPKEEIKEEPKVEQEEKTEQEQINQEIKQEFQQPEPVEEQEEFEEQVEDKEEPKEEPIEEKEEQSMLKQEEKETLLIQDKPKEREKDFEKTIISFLNKKEINIIEKQTIKKNRELNFVVRVPSNMGDLMYFVKAKNKKKVNEGELLLAFTEGQNLKLPTIYVTNAETTKKAINYMENNMKGLLYKKIKF